MKCLKPIKVNGSYFNCGSCRNCRANYTTSWKLRCLCELDSWNCATFLTLGYSDEWLISQGLAITAKVGTNDIISYSPEFQLSIPDMQNFLKRLRQYLGGRKIKYFLCGEYGELKKRPHYHMILFGVDWNDNSDREAMADAWLPRCAEFQFDRNRGKKCAIQPVTPEDIAYTCGYIQKKLNGERAKEEYGGKQAPFMLSSKGLGKDYALQHKSEFENCYTRLGPNKVGLPRYFRKVLDLSIEVKSKDKMTEEFKNDSNEFYRQFKKDFEKKGFPIVEKDSNLAFIARQFENWYESRQWTIANIIYQNFLQREKLRGN